MKQVIVNEFGGAEKLILHEVAKPRATAGHLVIKVEAAGVNFADSLQRQDRNVVPTLLPYFPGYEVAGVVEEIGAGVESISLGDRVVAMLPNSGGYAEYALTPFYLAAVLPPTLSLQESLGLQVQGLTAYLMAKDAAKIQAGQTVFIHAAAGGVGSLLIQIAKQMGAAKVIAAASTTEKLAIAKKLGADAVINYTEIGWTEKVKEATEGKGVDVMLCSTGGKLMQESFDCLAPFGRMIVYGNSSGSTTIEEVFSRFAMHNTLIQVFGLAGYFEKPELMQEAYQYLFSQAAEGKLKVHIGQIFPLKDAAEAHRQMENRKTIGKTVLIP